MSGELQGLREDVGELKAQHGEMAQCLSGMAPKVSRIDRELFGNGRPGLVVQMAKMQQQVKVGIWIATTIGGAGLVALVGIFFKMTGAG